MVVPVFVLMVPAYIVLFAAMIATAPRPSEEGALGAPPAFPAAMFGLFFLFMIFVMVISIIIGILFFFVFPLIVDRKLKAWPAVKLSAKAGLGNFGGVLGLMILCWLFSLIGVIACYVGVFLVVPITLAAQATAYRQVFPEEESLLITPPDESF
jgi:uncharacterized membrane protein